MLLWFFFYLSTFTGYGCQRSILHCVACQYSRQMKKHEGANQKLLAAMAPTLDPRWKPKQDHSKMFEYDEKIMRTTTIPTAK